ncbi:MAG: hypothetical protein GX997_02855 [Bacteroidales bacterium]|jgi:hypothetical protein|nr:hypothetical protein [Bacteroidales bacterium]
MKENNSRKNFNFFNILITLFLVIPCHGITQPLAGTDELGRVLPLNDEVGNLKKDRQVGIFYFLWQGDPTSPTSEYYWDLNKIIPEHPEVLEDHNNKYWGSRNYGFYYFWGEPLYRYYRGDDYWVHLRNMQLLTDAGIDFVAIDDFNLPQTIGSSYECNGCNSVSRKKSSQNCILYQYGFWKNNARNL